MFHTHEIVVPRTRVGHHIETEEPVRKEHLHLLVVRWRVSLCTASESAMAKQVTTVACKKA
jgi:hypothetical protein